MNISYFSSCKFFKQRSKFMAKKIPFEPFAGIQRERQAGNTQERQYPGTDKLSGEPNYEKS